MIRHILVPLDGSDLAESILPYVREFVQLTGASVTLFQAVEPVEPLLELSGMRDYERVELELQLPDESAAENYLSSVAKRLTTEGVIVHTRVAVGHGADLIIQTGGEFDLIAMATHGRSGVGRWVYGSVADKVLRGATVPVLLIRASTIMAAADHLPKRILVPLDGSDLAEQALPLATMLAQRARAELVLTRSINWVQEFGGVGAYSGAMSAVSLAELAEETARDYLKETADRLAQQKVSVVTDIRLDPAADGILICADEQKADLIVMCTHGRGGLGRWVYGSVADRVLRGATIPILLVRGGVPVEVEETIPLPAVTTQS